tara:strand:+ start:227 stop:415 length:189 start_codon:yes stop_codon:yes gene_type:complete
MLWMHHNAPPLHQRYWEPEIMYIVKEYLTGNTVAFTSRKEDAVAMMRSSSHKDDPKLILEKV